MKVRVTAFGGKTMWDSSVIELLLKNRQAIVHIQGGQVGRMLVTIEVDGQYMTGSVNGWDEAMSVVQRGVKQIITDFMSHIFDFHQPMELAQETADYFHLTTDDGEIPTQLVTWAEEVVGQQPPTSKPNVLRRALQMVGVGSFFFIIVWFAWLVLTNQVTF